MKTTILIILTGFVLLTGFKKIDKTKIIAEIDTSFLGTWEREFKVMTKLHTANYQIYQDSIKYQLTGLIGKANYLIKRDTFLLKTNRFIGHTKENQYYLILFKNITENSISIYKQKINSVSEGLTILIPNDTTTQNHGWNLFYKKRL